MGVYRIMSHALKARALGYRFVLAPVAPGHAPPLRVGGFVRGEWAGPSLARNAGEGGGGGGGSVQLSGRQQHSATETVGAMDRALVLLASLPGILQSVPAEALMREWEWDANDAAPTPTPERPSAWCLATVVSFWATRTALATVREGRGEAVTGGVAEQIVEEASRLFAPYVPFLQLECDGAGLHQLRMRSAVGTFQPDCNLYDNLLLGDVWPIEVD
jgi:hypothetical protein